MDLTRQIGYRGFAFNTVNLDTEQRQHGCELVRVAWIGAVGVGYSEKRAMADGRDASDVYLDRRVIEISGNLYGIDRADLYDRWQDLKTVLTPTAAFDSSPGDKGFLPFDFWVPTRHTSLFPEGYIHQMVLARPLGQPSAAFVSDMHGGEPTDPLSLRWDGAIECRDPRVYGYSEVEYDMEGQTSDSGDFVNRGDYPAPLRIMLVVEPLAAPGSITFTGAGSQFTITVPAEAADEQIIRYDSEKKVITREVNGVESLRMDLLTFATDQTHPLIQRGTTAWSWSRTGSVTLDAGSRFWHWDTWA